MKNIDEYVANFIKEEELYRLQYVDEATQNQITQDKNLKLLHYHEDAQKYYTLEPIAQNELHNIMLIKIYKQLKWIVCLLIFLIMFLPALTIFF